MRAARAMALTKFAAAVTEVMLPRLFRRVRNGPFLHRETVACGPQLTAHHCVCGVCAWRSCTPWHVGCDWALRDAAACRGAHSNNRTRHMPHIRIAQARGASSPSQGEELMQLVNIVQSIVRNFRRNEEGQDLLEYALLVALIALVAFGAVQAAGTSVNQIFTNIAAGLQTAASA
jgi:Flp pilus assembly pilin Flp